MRTSQRLAHVAAELADIALLNTPALSKLELAKTASRLLAAAGQVAIDERSIVVCPNCDSDLPTGCGGTFLQDGDACWLNRRAPPQSGGENG